MSEPDTHVYRDSRIENEDEALDVAQHLWLEIERHDATHVFDTVEVIGNDVRAIHDNSGARIPNSRSLRLGEGESGWGLDL